MSAPSRRFWLRSGLVAFIAIDLVALVALVLSHWAGLAPVQAWTLSLVMAAPVVPMLWAAADWVLHAAERTDWVDSAGDTVP